MVTFNAPFPAYAQILLRKSEIIPDYDDWKLKDGVVQAIYYGGIAAFVGKCFTSINPTYAACYGILRGALDQPSGTLVFNTLIGSKEKQGSTPPAMIYLSIAVEVLASMTVVWTALKIGESSVGAMSKITTRISPDFNGMGIKQALFIETAFIASGFGLYFLNKPEG